MLQRSIWSGLFLSAAVATVGLFGVQAQAQTAPGTEAAAPATPVTEAESVKLADDILHYSLVNNTELTKASADKLLGADLTAEKFLRAFESAADGRDFRAVLLSDLRRPDLKESLQKVLDKVDEGFRVVARDPVRVRGDIERLNGGPRPYQNAKDRLTSAGQFAVPIYLEYLQNAGKKDLHPYIIRLMGEIGRPILNPLIEELRVADPTLRIELINVIGQIGYPQALPALRAMDADATTPAETKLAVENAIALIDRTGRAATMSPAELYVAGGENYYSRKSSYLPPLADEKTNPVWYFDQGLNNVTPVQVPTEIWNSVMALRMAESTIRIDPNNAAAISLWMAANLKREIELPAGATDASKPAAAQDAAFYAKAAGPLYINPVLARALDTHDSALALRAIAALDATGGVTGLVADAESPLVRALSYPDRAVRFNAAFALARANPNTQFPSFFRVVPILAEAVSNSAAPTALLIVNDDDMRNAVMDALRNSEAHYTVYSGKSISGALEQARRAPAIDVVIIPNGSDVSRIEDIGRTDYRLTGVPVLVATKTAEIPATKLVYAQKKGYAVIDERSDEAAISAALASARTDIGTVAISADNANGFALTSLQLLDKLAGDHRSIYSINEATSALVDALKDKRTDVVTAAAGVLGKLNSPEGERALGVAALNGSADGDTRAMLFHNLAESAKRTGNSLDGSQVNAIIKIVTTEADVKVRGAAAEALGALNVPSNQASTLILQQAR